MDSSSLNKERGNNNATKERCNESCWFGSVQGASSSTTCTTTYCYHTNARRWSTPVDTELVFPPRQRSDLSCTIGDRQSVKQNAWLADEMIRPPRGIERRDLGDGSPTGDVRIHLAGYISRNVHRGVQIQSCTSFEDLSFSFRVSRDLARNTKNRIRSSARIKLTIMWVKDAISWSASARVPVIHRRRTGRNRRDEPTV